MATSSDHMTGYQCEFIDSVPDDFYCKKCNMVAKKLTVCNSCMESYCYACITDTLKQGQPCLTCGEEHFQALPHVKYQKRMKELRVYCSLKERGCSWSGTLEQLDTHLDPDKDNCQYVDTKCPLDCKQAIPKNKVEQHVSEECVKRDYFCQYCSFKATYEEVVNKHLPECKYVPLDCPNMCGVTFERDFMEDHMKICRLEEVECEFSGVGCEEKYRREDHEEHIRQNSQKHLTLTASLAKQLQQKLEEQDKKYRDKKVEEQNMKIEKLEKRCEEQERKIKEQEKKCKGQEEKIEEHKKKIEDQKSKIQEQEKLTQELKKATKKEHEQKLKEQGQLLEQKFNSKFQELEKLLKETKAKSDQNEIKHRDIVRILGIQRTFEMRNYSTEVVKTWMSPAMYTHNCGYKFCIQVFIFNGTHIALIHSMPGEFDNQLNWPAKAKFTIELVHQRGGNNFVGTSEGSWDKYPDVKCTLISIYLLKKSQIHNFLVNDTLHFVSNVKLL